MNKKLYLAYGSNLYIEQMKHRCPDAELLGFTQIPNMRLVYRGSRTGFFLSIEPCAYRFVPCGVFRVSAVDEMYLDAYEGYPKFYNKMEISGLYLYAMDGTKRGGTMSAFVYYLPPASKYGLPSDGYVNICRSGYDFFNFDKALLDDALSDTRRMMK